MLSFPHCSRIKCSGLISKLTCCCALPHFSIISNTLPVVKSPAISGPTPAVRPLQSQPWSQAADSSLMPLEIYLPSPYQSIPPSTMLFSPGCASSPTREGHPTSRPTLLLRSGHVRHTPFILRISVNLTTLMTSPRFPFIVALACLLTSRSLLSGFSQYVLSGATRAEPITAPGILLHSDS